MLAQQHTEHNQVQLGDQVRQNRGLATEMESEKSRVHNLFGHKDVEIIRLTSEVQVSSQRMPGLRRDWLL